ncbi:hypothetical protein AAGG42_08390 [Stenotrophomonas maltophilia]|uniref:hypothetical protein n=1 Tax=Stenotrophomonas maltophilia TaxID=40324 RepID=UPI003145127A
MSRAKQIRQWLAENPGWHFAADVCDCMEIAAADDRAKHARSLSNMVTLGLLDGVGRRRFMKYRANRNAYYRPTEGNA